MPNHLQMSQIEKSFSGVDVLKKVDLVVQGGEIHALLGANGAGKSTLIKILSGAYTLDEGQILINQESVTLSTPQDAKQLGIHTVYQEVDTALVPSLSVAENIFIDQLAQKQGPFLVSWKNLYQRATELLRKTGTDISVKKHVSELSLSQKQMVLVTRAVAQNARFVIFDEPTAPLSVRESEQLYEVMRQLKNDGVGVIFITHRLAEVFELSDRITVLRDGQVVSSKRRMDTSVEQVIEHMLGQSLQDEFPKTTVRRGERLLEAKGLSDGRKVKCVDLHVAEGEIVGVFGLVGAGKTETARLLFGAERKRKGELFLYQQAVKCSVQWKQPVHAVQNGVVLVPEERRKEGLIIQETVKKNLSLATLKAWTQLGFIRSQKEKSMAQEMIKELGVKTRSIDQNVHHLSGGNQQKIVVGKWLLKDASVYMFDEPTKGIDVGAKKEIYHLIGKLAQQGKGILYFSCEHNEVIGIADRVLVMAEGRIVKELQRDEATQEKLMYYASGGQDCGTNENNQTKTTTV